MEDRFLESCLVLPFTNIAASDGAERVVARLGLEQVRDRVAGFDQALTASLWHDSYLHEHRDDAPELTPGVLRALDTLGAAWISRELATTLAQTRHHEKPGSISTALATIRTALNRCHEIAGAEGRQPPLTPVRVALGATHLHCSPRLMI